MKYICVCVYIYIYIYIYTHLCVSAQLCPTLRPPGLQPTRLLCPWDSLGKNTGVGCHFFLQRIFLTQESNPRLCVSCTDTGFLYHCATREGCMYTYIYVYIPKTVDSYCAIVHGKVHMEYLQKYIIYQVTKNFSKLYEVEILQAVLCSMLGIINKNRKTKRTFLLEI